MKTAFLLALLLHAIGNTVAAQALYAEKVQPLLKERCWACHGGLKQEGSLRLDTAELIRKGGDSGAAVVVGKPDESVLIQRISAQDQFTRMPPEGAPLTAEEISDIRDWIASGAVGLENERPEADPRDHWAFHTPQRPQPPLLHGVSWDANPIDAFLLSRMSDEKLSPRPLAHKSTLLRRAYLDLVGVPPTREELHAFLNDDSPDAWNRVVDSLLNDPRYGERWARHWM
ncbi:MAG: DUF1549 domain-containing protein, partial [Planctomycetaceae bacterium]|nr:DUF1549 domain-containing protein [Planctomycetaceae bacterium]